MAGCFVVPLHMFLKRYFSTTGLLLGTLFFALSMSPTLLPRTNVIQGLISGLAMASGYGIGVFGIWFYSYLQLPKPDGVYQKRMQQIAAGLFLITAVIFLWRASGWQNSLRELMGLEQGPGVQPVVIGLVAVLVFLLVVLMARLFSLTFKAVSRQLQKIVPKRVSWVMGLITSFFLFWSVIDGVFFSFIFETSDRTYQQIDAALEPEYERPVDALKAGSNVSLLSWEDMGRQGRRFISSGPSATDIAEFLGEEAKEPIRVYTGMNSADSIEERAELALRELIRLDAFSRSMLILITPTGTGWIDPAGIDPLEYLHRGDIASIAAQYSYLPSPLALLTEEEYGEEMAQALFGKVYGYWTTLSPETRPRLYLHGLSLGAMNSDNSFDLYDIIADPFDGALWVGPPFRKQSWVSFTDQRQSGSPEWKPVFRDGSVVRFANQNGGLETGEVEWGSFRIAYLQYASDPVTFFKSSSATNEPDWMKPPRGPDVSDHLRWYPIVTSLQLAADMAFGIAPRGFGHEYAAEHYIDSWYHLTEPEGWNEHSINRLKALFSENKP